MSDEQSNQPRKVKDLKARLGRTIAPSTPGAALPAGLNLPIPPGAAPAADAGAAGAGGVVPPPNLPAPNLPAPAAGTSPLSAPLPGPKAVVEPPWVKQQREDEERRRLEDEARRKRAAADPFAAAAAPTGPQAVRIVVDDSALEAAETGKKGKNVALIGVIVVVALVSIGIGKFIGSMMAQRAVHNAGVDAAEQIYREVQRGDAALQAVKTKAEALIAAAQVGPGKTPHVDYAALQAMLQVENPFTAEHFRETRYTAFDTASVDAMLKYYNSTREVFSRIERLGRAYNIRNESSRAQLNASFAAFDNFARMPVGCVPVVTGSGAGASITCSMVFIDRDHPAADGIPTRSRPTAAPTNRMLYTGTALNADNSDKLFIPVNMQVSADVMGSTLHLHDRFMRDLAELKNAIETSIQARADFRNELNRVRQLPRQSTF